MPFLSPHVLNTKKAFFDVEQILVFWITGFTFESQVNYHVSSGHSRIRDQNVIERAFSDDAFVALNEN